MNTSPPNPLAPIPGRGAGLNPPNRFERLHVEVDPDCPPEERQFKLTRQCLQVCAELRHPIFIITKNALVTRDLDVLVELARHQCIGVHVSVTSLDTDLAGKLEPRASRPQARLQAIRELS